jgi:N-acetylmuramic acid 6-phosphate etherase
MSTDPKQFVIGVDGGGSKTAAVILDLDGRVLGRGNSGSSNYHHGGLEQVRDHLWEAMQMAAQASAVEVGDATAVTWSLAGVDRPIDKERLGAIAAAMLPGIAVQIENDALASLTAGLTEIVPGQPIEVGQEGIVLIAGTGTITIGQNSAGKIGRASGWGYLLEKGGGYNLACEALHTINEAVDGSAPHTTLIDRVIAELELQQITDVITWLYAPEREIPDVAALCPLIIEEAATGDLSAMKVVLRGAGYLADAVVSVATQLDLLEQPFPLVLSGSLLSKSRYYRDLVIQTVRTRLPSARPFVPQLDPATGSALRALKKLGLTVEPGNEGYRDSFPPVWPSEERNVMSEQLDGWPTLNLVGLMHLQDQQAVGSVWPVLPQIAAAVDAIAQRMQNGGRLIYVGSGTSGRLGILDASECPPTFNADPEQVIGLIAGGQQAITHSIEGAEDDPIAARDAVKKLGINKRDSVVGIAASGRTSYVLGALQTARGQGALTIALTCNLPAPITRDAAHVIAPLVGPEVLTGSTRLKAGTVQKLVLNMISTGVMVRLGKTYGNLMVDLQLGNMKLRERAARIVAQACDISIVDAKEKLRLCGDDVKVAIVTTLADISPVQARQHLMKTDGVIRLALAASQGK